MSGTGNITDDPMFESPTEDDFNLEWGSPCINAGDPNSPLDPDSTIADMGALYFDMGPGFEQRPNAVTDLTVSHHNELLIATLAWINPTVNTMGFVLTELDGIKIYRDAVMIDNVTDVSIGAPYSYDDMTIPCPEEYEYEVVPYNSYGDGIGSEISCWIGLDRPGFANNTVATPDSNYGMVCTITWDDPTEGEQGAYWPAGSWMGQKVYRDGSLLADLPGTNNVFVDDNIYSPGFYSYGVSYYNGSGEGPVTPASPDPVFIGTPQFEQIPYSWVEISILGNNTSLVQDNQTLKSFDIGFRFPFYDGTFFNGVLINSNGRMSFTDSPLYAYENDPIPYPLTPNNLIAPYWDDFEILDGAVYYFHDAVNDRFIVEYKNVSHVNTGGNYTFETILYPNGDIDFRYQDLTPGTLNSATVGIENATGTDGIQVTYNGSGPIEPESELGIRIYSVSSGAPPPPTEVSIILTPYSPPIQVPASGGSFSYNALLSNNEIATETVDVWIMMTLPNGRSYGPVLGPVNLTLPVNYSLDRDRTQEVPATAPTGMYTYIGHVGVYPDTVYDSSSFEFEKLSTVEGVWFEAWNNYGETFDEWLTANEISIPDFYSLDQNYPNPFNPVTMICFKLPKACPTRLEVYDVQGKHVAQLLDGWRERGVHEVTFDGSGLVSGVYLYWFEAGDFSASGKMVLMK